MKAANDKLLVRVNDSQKNTFLLNGVETTIPILFETNYREKSPVIAQAISSNDFVNDGDLLLCHHNTFYFPSPYNLYDDVFSIPANGNIIFCKLNIHDGCLLPIFGNMLCDKIDIETGIELPISERKQHDNMVAITDPGYCNYHKGDVLFTRPSAAYCIVYNWKGVVNRVHKVPEEQVCGVLIEK